jgi:hypothetical protein
MLLTLTMLPRPLAAIPGASAATRKNGARTLLANILSNAVTSNSAVGAEERDPGVVDEDVNVADVAGQALNVGGIAQVGRDEARLAAGGGDLLDGLGAARGVAAVDQDLRAVAGQLQRDRAADARRRPGDERPLSFEIVRGDR